MIEEINEEEVYKEFEEELLKAIAIYEVVEGVVFPQLDIFIADRVWNSLEKYTRMELKTKEKFFEELQRHTPVSEYEKGISELWNIDHKDMTRSIEELQKMVIQRDFKDAEMYGDKKITRRSIKLLNNWEDFKLIDKELYEIHPERDFKAIEQRFVNRHIKLYKNTLKRYKDSKDLSSDLANFMKVYDKLDKTIPYFSHTTGKIIHYVDVSTYNSMLYNVNLTRSAWNRSIYDAKLLGNHLWYLPAHPFACPSCAIYQGRVYADKENLGYPLKQVAIDGGVGHPNCKHVWVSYWGLEQIQNEKYNSSEWVEKYKNKQKIQSLDLQKSRLLADRRIYKSLGQQDLVDKTTAKIKTLRLKKEDLLNQQKGIYTNKLQEYKNIIAKKQQNIKEKELQKIIKEKEAKKLLQKQSSATHKEMQELFKIRENRPKYIEQLERKQQELKEARKIINQNNKDMKYWEAKQQELSLKVDIKNLKELINK